MRHLTVCLKEQLPEAYKDAVGIILQVLDIILDKTNGMSIEYMVLPDYIEINGIDDLDTSIQAIEKITQLASCEFAVRSFIIRYPNEMMRQMLLWSKHESHLVRRLASEGCRPRLPWAMALPDLKKDPSSIIPILENMKNDDSEFVRKSVANNLNDISKDNPELVIQLVNKWKGKSKNTDWIIKHGCRTMLKQGNSEVLELFGFGSLKSIGIQNFKLLSSKVKVGDNLEFSFEVSNKDSMDTMIRLEYGIYYLKANRSLSRKVYQISEKSYTGNSLTTIKRKQSFRIISTRKFHFGGHQLTIIANGKEFGMEKFVLHN